MDHFLLILPSQINAILSAQQTLMHCIVFELAKDAGIIFFFQLGGRFAVIKYGRTTWEVVHST